jgi:hypothetical protein
MPLPRGFHTNPFGYMANPNQATFKFSPASVEERVQNYLDRLSDAVRTDVFDYSNRTDALVFGEWGHGKSHVFYRTAHLLEKQHPGVLCLRLAPETLSPLGILRATLAEASRRRMATSGIQAALDRVRDHDDDDMNALPVVATALADLAQPGPHARFTHAVILFDEAQTMRTDFQEFLRELTRTFRQREVNLHTMQCHSLASLDAARKIAAKLKDWLDRAQQIHLPSIQANEAHEFFRSRLRSCTDSDELAETFIPEGVAKTLCDAAGGNPRKMLQLAERVAASLDSVEDARLTGRQVLAAFREMPGARANSRLYSEGSFRRIYQLAPQEHPNVGAAVAEFLQAHIESLYGESEPVSVNRITAWRMQRAPGISINALLSTLTGKIDDTELLEAAEDEFGATIYRLSHAFRSKLSEAFASAGATGRKQKQVDLMFRPAECQQDLVTGLLQILRRAGLVTGRFDEVRLPDQDEEKALLGFVTQMPIRDAKYLYTPVLVTALCNMQPSAAALGAINDGLSQGRWDRAVVLFHDERSSWGGEPGAEPSDQLSLSRRQHATVEVIDESVWKDWIREAEGDPGSAGTKAVRMFASVQEFGESPDDSRLSVEDRSVFEKLKDEVNQRLLSLDEVCYLPTNDELTVLRHPVWERDGTLSLTDLTTNTGVKTDGNLVANLVGSFLTKQSAKFARRTQGEWPLCKAVQEVLKSKKTLAVGDIVPLLRQRHVVASRSSVLEPAVEWVCEELCRMERAEKTDPLLRQYAFKDLQATFKAEMKKLKESMRKLIKEYEALERMSARAAAPHHPPFEAIKKRVEMLEAVSGPSISSSHLKEAQAASAESCKTYNALDSELVSLERRRVERFEQHDNERADIDKLRSQLSPAWREEICPEARIDTLDRTHRDVRAKLNALGIQARGRSAEDLLLLLEGPSERLLAEMQDVRGRLRGTQQATTPLDQIRSAVARHTTQTEPFSKIVVTVEEGS